jgi:hypothetical protein
MIREPDLVQAQCHRARGQLGWLANRMTAQRRVHVVISENHLRIC